MIVRYRLAVSRGQLIRRRIGHGHDQVFLADRRVRPTGIDGRGASRLVSGCGGPDLHRGGHASAGSETIVVMTCGFLQVGPCLDHDHRHSATALGSPTPISITKTTGRTAAETLAPPATYGLRSPGRRPSDRSLSRLNRPLLAHPCRCVSLQRPKFDARGNTLATSLVARRRHTGVSAPRGNRKVPNRKVPNLSDSGYLS